MNIDDEVLRIRAAEAEASEAAKKVRQARDLGAALTRIVVRCDRHLPKSGPKLAEIHPLDDVGIPDAFLFVSRIGWRPQDHHEVPRWTRSQLLLSAWEQGFRGAQLERFVDDLERAKEPDGPLWATHEAVQVATVIKRGRKPAIEAWARCASHSGDARQFTYADIVNGAFDKR